MKIDLRTNVAGAAPIAEGSAARKVAGAIDRSSFARSGATGGFGRSGAALVDSFSQQRLLRCPLLVSLCSFLLLSLDGKNLILNLVSCGLSRLQRQRPPRRPLRS